VKIAISCDHRGVGVQSLLTQQIQDAGHELIDAPTCTTPNDGCDYPDMAWGVANAVSEGRADRGILICGSGIGMCIAANKVKGIRAALVHDDISAEMARRHNDSNIVCLSADLLGQPLIRKIVQIWLSTPFEGGRHARRVNKITAIENGDDPATVTE